MNIHKIPHLAIYNAPFYCMNEQKLNILVDAHIFDQVPQGSRTFIKEIYSTLHSYKNLRIHLAAYDIQNLKKEFPGEDFIFIQYKSNSRIIRLFYDIPRIIKKYAIDYAHFQYLMPFYGNCKSIVTIHDLLFLERPADFPFMYRWSRKYVFKQTAKRASIVTTVSPYSRFSIVTNFSINPHKICVIPNGVSPEFFTGFDKANSKQRIMEKRGINNFILYVSRVEPRKNHAALIRSFISLNLSAKGYHLVMAGEKSLRAAELNALLHQIPPKEKEFIHFVGEVDDEELLQLYRAADLFIYPSRAEGFGIPPLEAGAVGIPVICSNKTGMRSYTFFGESHIDPDNEELLKERITKELDNRDNEKTLKIKEKIRKDYSWQSSADELYRVIMKHHTGKDVASQMLLMKTPTTASVTKDIT